MEKRLDEKALIQKIERECQSYEIGVLFLYLAGLSFQEIGEVKSKPAKNIAGIYHRLIARLYSKFYDDLQNHWAR